MREREGSRVKRVKKTTDEVGKIKRQGLRRRRRDGEGSDASREKKIENIAAFYR